MLEFDMDTEQGAKIIVIGVGGGNCLHGDADDVVASRGFDSLVEKAIRVDEHDIALIEGGAGFLLV